jgi:hypothetical protein
VSRFTDKFTRLDRLLSTVGDGTGTTNANVDGSVTPVVFKILPPATGSIVIVTMHVYIRDTGAFSLDKYGALTTRTNGTQIGVFNQADDSLAIDYTAGLPIRANGGLMFLAFESRIEAYTAGDDFCLSRFRFADTGIRTILRSGDETYFGAKVRDDLTGLVEHLFLVRGFSRPGGPVG